MIDLDSGFLTSSLYTGEADRGFVTQARIQTAPATLIPAERNQGPANALPGVQISQGNSAASNLWSQATAVFSGAVSWFRKAWSNMTSIGSILKGIVKARQFLWNFNWQSTDAQISQKQEAIMTALAGQWGETSGQVLGRYFCGGLVSKGLKKNAPQTIRTDPALIAKLQELERLSWNDSGELYEEAIDSFKESLKATQRAFKQYVGWEAFKNVRTIIRAANAGLGINSPLIENWGKEGNDPWSFASTVENWVESFDGATENFLEEFVDNFMDACDESLLAVATAYR